MGSGAHVDPRHLREVLEFALAVAREAQKRHGFKVPPGLRPFLRDKRVPTARLGALARAVEGAPEFLEVLAQASDVDTVGEIGVVWLRREHGWEARLVELAAEAEAERAAASSEARVRSAERRRDQATAARHRVEAELVVAREQIEALRRELDARQVELGELHRRVGELENEVAVARDEARRARQRADSLATRLAATRSELAEAQAATPVADDVARLSDAQRAALGDVTKAAAELADRLAELEFQLGDPGTVAPSRRSARRRPQVRPGGVRAGTAEEAEFLLRSGAVVFVDGYNVAKLAWPGEELEVQRERLVMLAETVALRFNADLTVVFDGADVPGASASRRRAVRVMFSPPGVIADDVIRAEVGRTPVSRAVVVVTDDREIVRDVKAVGADVISSPVFAAL